MMLFAWLVASRARTPTLVVTAFFVALFREDMALWVVLVLLVGWRTGRLDRYQAAAAALLPLLWSLLSLTILLPDFSPTDAYLYEETLLLAFLREDPVGLIVSLSAIKVAFLAIPFGLAVTWDNRAMIFGAAALPVAG